MTTRAEFRTELTTWSKRPDLSQSQLDTFINLALAELDQLRTVEQEIGDQLTLSDSYVALPADFLKMRQVSSSLGRESRVLLPGSRTLLSQIAAAGRGSPVPSEATHYGIQHGQLYIPLGGDGTFDIIYWQRVLLPADTSTHPMTDRWPQLVIQAGLYHLHHYLGDYEAAGVALSAYDRTVRVLDGTNGAHGAMGGAG